MIRSREWVRGQSAHSRCLLAAIAMTGAMELGPSLARAEEIPRARVLVMSGQQAPGLPQSTTFVFVTTRWYDSSRLPSAWPRLTPTGDFGFSAFVTDNPLREIWAYRNGSIERVGAEARPFPGDQEPPWPFFHTLIGGAAAAGDRLIFKAYSAQVEYPGTHIWGVAAEGADRLVAESWTSPGFHIRSYSAAQDGSIIVWGRNTAGKAFFRWRDGVLSRIIGDGDPAPGFETGSTIAWLYDLDIHTILPTSRLGEFTINGYVTDNGAYPITTEAVWFVNAQDQVELLATNADQLPGLPANSSMQLFFDNGIDSAGTPGIWALFNTPEQSGMICVWRGTREALAPYVCTGDAAPQVEAGAVIQSPDLVWPIGFGGMFMEASIAGPLVPLGQEKCLWLDQGTGPRLIARSGRGVPFLPSGATLDLIPQQLQRNMNVSPTGRIVFQGQIVVPETPTRRAFFATDRVGRIRQVFAVGDTLADPATLGLPVDRYSSIAIGDDGGVVAEVVLDPLPAQYKNAIIRIDVDCLSPACDYADVVGNDCMVTLDDLTAVLADFGKSGPLLAGDADLNDRVDITDLTHVLLTFGMDCNE